MKKSFIVLFLFVMAGLVFGSGYKVRDKSEVNPFDRTFMMDYNKALDYTATGLELIAMGMPALCLVDSACEDFLEIGIQYAETIGIAWAVRTIVKHAAYRPRPYMYFAGAPEKEIENGDWHRSFMSGHAIVSFAAAGFTTFTFLRYCPDSKIALPVIAGTYGVAVTTSILRILSGNHFTTDVLAGAATGTAIGYLVPLLNTLWFEPALKNTPLSVTPTSVKVSFAW